MLISNFDSFFFFGKMIVEFRLMMVNFQMKRLVMFAAFQHLPNLRKRLVEIMSMKHCFCFFFLLLFSMCIELIFVIYLLINIYLFVCLLGHHHRHQVQLRKETQKAVQLSKSKVAFRRVEWCQAQAVERFINHQQCWALLRRCELQPVTCLNK